MYVSEGTCGLPIVCSEICPTNHDFCPTDHNWSNHFHTFHPWVTGKDSPVLQAGAGECRRGTVIRMFINQFVPSVYSSPLVGNTTHDQCVVDDLSGPQSSLQCQDHSRCLSTEASLVLIFVNFCTTSPVCLGYVIPAEQSATARTYIRGQVLVTLATHSQRDIRLISLHTESSIHSPRDIPEPSASNYAIHRLRSPYLVEEATPLLRTPVFYHRGWYHSEVTRLTILYY